MNQGSCGRVMAEGGGGGGGGGEGGLEKQRSSKDVETNTARNERWGINRDIGGLL